MDHNDRDKLKKLEKGRHIYRTAANLVLFVIEVALFYYIWIRFYNPYFRYPYVFKGNIFASGVYAALILIIARFYGRQRLGYHKSFNIIFGLSVSMILTNIVAYAFIILQAATWYMSPFRAVVWLSLIDIVIIIVWCLIFNRIFRRIFPPNRMILLAGRGADETVARFALRTDRYDIESVVQAEDEIDRGLSLDELTAGLGSFDAVIVGDMRSELRNDILKYCYSKGIRTYTVPKITDIILKDGEVMELFDTPIVLNRNTGLSPEQEIVKRIEDIVLSLTGLVIACPFMLIIAAAIKLEDGGPVLFRQERVTKGGRTFSILKFRSMIVDAEAEGVSIPATGDDPRITKVGHVIRPLRLDELPQIFNILRGDMSVVGPRPERVEHVREYETEVPEFSYRLLVKGGLTGYAQIYGRYNTSAYDKLKMDLIYISEYSLILDLEIILRTIQVLFMRESTEGFSEEQSEAMSEKCRDDTL